MALPLVPVAAFAAKYGAVALAGYALSRQVQRGRTDQRAEDALDELGEGVHGHRPRDRDQVNASARFVRVVRIGTSGPGLEIDLSAIGRIRFRKV